MLIPVIRMKDKRGVERGHCKQCDCQEYTLSPGGHKCGGCSHLPAQHVKLDAADSKESTSVRIKSEPQSDSQDIMVKKEYDEDVTVSQGSRCTYPGCHLTADFDVNTGESSSFCLAHIGATPSLDPNGSGWPRETRATPTYMYTCTSTGTLEIASTVRPKCKLDGCQRDCYVNDDGTVYDCCSRGHGRKYLEICQQRQQQTGQLPTADISLEKKCRNPWCTRPRYSEGETVHDFCGITCRNNYQKALSQGNLPQVPLCQLPGCKLPCYADANNTFLKFCGNNHKQSMEKRVFWELGSGDQKFVKVKAHFEKMWVKYHPVGTIVGIYKVFSPTMKSKFKSYRTSLPKQEKESHFHGTAITCDLKNSKTACTDAQCGICNISRCGFCPKRIGSNIGRFKRFGHGFYLAPNSSKCHDYTKGIVDYRAMLLCSVAPGSKHTLKHDNTSLTAPPSGCHSVYGASGGSLNYDEIVLYDCRAILPKYVIIYHKDGIDQIAA